MKNLLSGVSAEGKSAVQNPIVWVVALVLLIGLGWSSQQSWFPIRVELKNFNPQELLSAEPKSESASPTVPSSEKTEKREETKDLSAYWAVTLDTDQVFYGKLKKGSPYLEIREAFYYQPGIRAASQGNIRIIKVGTELHGPEDRVMINKSHVVTTQQLTPESKIVQAIDQYLRQGGGN